jgi:putative hemolysin
MNEAFPKLIVMLFLLLLSALFSSSETSLFSLKKSELIRLKRSRQKYARYATKLLSKPRETLITILIGNETVNVSFAAATASFIYTIAGRSDWRINLLASIFVATPLVLIFGEIAPKNIAIRLAPSIIPLLVFPIRLFYWLATPIRVILTWFSERTLQLIITDSKIAKPMIVEEEFKRLIDIGHSEGALEEGERDLIHSLLALGDTKVLEIMTPRDKIFSLSLLEPFEEILRKVKEARFSRIPVYKNTPHDIIGAIHARDIFRLYRLGEKRQPIESIIRPIQFFFEDEPVENVLSEFQRRQIHIGVVLDCNMKVIGLVTMEDIFGMLFKKGAATKIRAAKTEIRNCK